jgi:hypothetical protein
MKKLIENIGSILFEPYKDLLWKNINNVLLWSLKLYSLVLAPYLTAVFIGTLLSILFGGFTDFISNIPNFTVKYFYDGHLFNLIAWRVHLFWFVLCLLININEELR